MYLVIRYLKKTLYNNVSTRMRAGFLRRRSFLERRSLER
jgi:hypothetical protein